MNKYGYGMTAVEYARIIVMGFVLLREDNPEMTDNLLDIFKAYIYLRGGRYLDEYNYLDDPEMKSVFNQVMKGLSIVHE